MSKLFFKRPVDIWIITIAGCIFGLASVKSGGSVLLIDGTFRESVGNYIPFVVWFNFIFGFVYVTAVVGLWFQKRWAVWLSLFVVIATSIVFVILMAYIFNGISYESRTIYAMGFRLIIWLLISIVAYNRIIRTELNNV